MLNFIQLQTCSLQFGSFPPKHTSVFPWISMQSMERSAYKHRWTKMMFCSFCSSVVPIDFNYFTRSEPVHPPVQLPCAGDTLCKSHLSVGRLWCRHIFPRYLLSRQHWSWAELEEGFNSPERFRRAFDSGVLCWVPRSTRSFCPHMMGSFHTASCC